MRVLQVAAKMFSLANFVLPLMKRLRAEGFTVEALGQYDGYEKRLREAGFTTHPWALGHTFNPFIIWRARKQLSHFLREHPYDIVHTHCSFGGIVGNPVASRRTPCVLYTQHGFYVHDGLSWTARKVWLEIEKIGLRHAHYVICVSQAEKDLAAALNVGSNDKFITIPGAGVDIAQFQLEDAERERRRRILRRSLGLHELDVVLLTVSRLTWDKGYREMIEAARRLKEEGRAFKFLAAGSGKDEKDIRKAIQQAGLTRDFWLLGWWDKVLDLYCAADIFVFASHREGLPIAPIEAMANGLPIVASDIPGCREEIEHEKSGLLYPVGEVQALTNALKRVLESPKLARRLAREAQKRAWQFDSQHVLDLQVEFYRQLARRQ